MSKKADDHLNLKIEKSSKADDHEHLRLEIRMSRKADDHEPSLKIQTSIKQTSMKRTTKRALEMVKTKISEMSKVRRGNLPI